ncbi:DNA mismatch repair protein Msh6 [Nosema granulosis]|uniref:DNA mismatch repair protein Msh6 n=1 Tax=Nosema granulosis TaxID=83296 RepID=A0A9P6H0G9_9MICR|nr:DNA mismatch repair protein Msh6 [Nosema granulosis]
MKKNLLDYFKSSPDTKSKSSPDIKLESSTQEKEMLVDATQCTMTSTKENKTNIEVSIESSFISEMEKDWPSDQIPNKHEIESEKTCTKKIPNKHEIESDKTCTKKIPNKHEIESEKTCTKKIKNEESIKNTKQNENKQENKKDEKKKNENRYSFLVEVKDKFGRSKDEEEYDRSTLFISEADLSSLTPFERQFWEIKKDYFDTVVFFKKGKFYELYEEDADISAKLFNMKITERVNMRMTGFPESSYDEWASKFLEAGYKIARVEQSENAIGKQIREKSGAKKDKIINRELKEVITQGTIYDSNHLKTKYSTYLCAIRRNLECGNEECKSDRSGNHFSIVLYDASISTMHASTFCDDQFHTTLRGFFLKYPIMEYLNDRKYDFGSAWIRPEKHRVVSEHSKHFNDEEYECFCMIYNYLTYLKREDSLRDIKVVPLEGMGGSMKLETSTIVNMELFETKENKKTLFNAINNCSTPGGERLLRNWLLHPLGDYSEIQKRQNIVKIFNKFNLEGLVSELKTLGDVERAFSKLSKEKVSLKDLNNYLGMVKKMVDIYNELETVFNSKSTERINIKKFSDMGDYEGRPAVSFDIKSDLDVSLKSFLDKYRITKDEILPGKNNVDELQGLLEDKENLTKEFKDFLELQKQVLSCKSLNYKSIGKEIFQIEVPKEGVQIPEGWFLVSTTKSTNRFYTKEIKEKIQRYVEIEEKIFQSQGNLLKRAIAVLLEDSKLFEVAIRDISQVDCLVSFTLFSLKNDCCVPVVGEKIEFKGLRNPIYTNYIPNDYEERNRIVVLTGSNMSGKSTFMRSVCLNIILFQMGMCVCAEYFSSPLFDRLFTRIGASDNLSRGESTFMVELSEISTVLRFATEKSFVLVDELGRGTSVKDGKSIAKAVVEKLQEMQCRVLFSTHYHCLIRDAALCYMDSKIVNNDLIFLYKLKEGECKDSNGIYVAKLAGVPNEIIKQAWINRERLLKNN